MKRLIGTEALVLRKRNLMNTDVMLTFLTKDLGKLTVIGKGIKKLTSRRAAHTQTGNLVTIHLYSKGEMHYLQDTNIISAFSQIKKDQEKVNYLYQFLFILDRILPEQQPEPRIYSTAVAFLIYESKTAVVSPAKYAGYLQEVIHILGYGSRENSLPEMYRNIEEIINEKIPEHVII